MRQRPRATLEGALIPEPWTTETFPFARQPKLNRKAVMALYDTLDFIPKAQSIIRLGGPGVGKTGLATSFLTRAIQQGCSVPLRALRRVDDRFVSLGGRSFPGTAAPTICQLRRAPDRRAGYPETEPVQVGLFFTLMQRRHKKKPTLITSNLGFREWGSFLKNDHLTAALIDRLTECSHVFNMRECVGLRPKLWPSRELAGASRAAAWGTPGGWCLQLSGAQPDRYDPHKWHTCRACSPLPEPGS